MASTTTAVVPDKEEIKKDIVSRLEASGQYAKMKAMIVEAALRSLKQEKSPTDDPFVVTESQTKTLSSTEGKLALGVVVDFLEHLGLQYTASVLKLETGVEEVPSASSVAASLRLSPPGSSCSLLELLRGGPPAISTTAVSPTAVLSTTEVASDREEEDHSSTHSEHHSESSSHSHSDVGVHSGSEASSAKSSRSSSAVSDAKPEENGVALKGAEDTTYFVSKWKGRTVIRTNQVAGQQVQLEYLEDCKVYILDPLDSSTVDDCEGGELVIAACESSVFLRNCKRMTVHIACKQLRLRDCEDMDLRLFTTTDPVIEMSHHISYRPFHLRLPGLIAHMASCRLDPKLNRFVHVYDFTEDETSLPTPHFTVCYPEHGLRMEDRCAEHGTPECPKEIEDLLALRLMPAASSETGDNKSYNIKTGAKVWTGQSPTAHEHDAVPLHSTEEKKPPLAPAPAVAVGAAAAHVTTRGGLDGEEYSDFEDDSDANNSDDNVSVDEDDDEF